MVSPGNVPINGIPLSTIEHAGTELYHMVGRFFGGGLTAGRLHAEMEGVDFDGLEDIRKRLSSASGYVSGDLLTELRGIQSDMDAAYQGAASDPMSSQFQQAQTTATDLGPKFTTLAGQVSHTQDGLNKCWNSVKGYSRLGSDVSNVTSLVGGDSQDDKAEKAWNECKGTLQASGSQLQNVSGGSGWQGGYGQSTPVPTNPPAGYEDPGSVGPGGPGPGGPGPGTYGPGPGGHGPGPGGPGPGPGGYGPGPGGWGPGGHGPGPGGYGPGPGGPGPGAGIDDGSTLAGVGGGGPGPGGGLGGDASGLGSGSGLDRAGGAGSGAGSASTGAGTGAAGRGGVGVPGMPMRGGGSGSNDSERERDTWLTEDEDVWGADGDSPDGVIS